MYYKKIFATLLCVSLSLFCFFSIGLFQYQYDFKDTHIIEEGYQKLEQLDNQSIKKVELKIKQASKKATQKKINKKINKESLSHRFGESVILGDSMAESLLEYQLLPSQCVLAKRGRNTKTCDLEIQQAISLSPDIIFMAYGMNDLEYFRGRSQKFIAQYEKQIRILQTSLPHTKIYVNSIVPMDPHTFQEHPYYKKYKEYNKQIKKMCQKLKITYIDNESILDWTDDVYEKDGVHPKYSYYPLWLSHMAEVANL